jgi:hypothetical protein
VEHVRQQEDLIDETLGGLIKMTDEKMAENGWVRLPKDADGEYIHIGDVIDCGESTFKVNELRLTKAGWNVGDCRHHKPTVEDLLREMMREASCNIYADGSCEMGLTDEQLAEYAQKLQLRED